MRYNKAALQEALHVSKPRIGITRSGSAERISPSYQSYHDRVIEAGGEPVDLHTSLTASPAELVAGLDGLILSGGPDVVPARYGVEAAPETDKGDPLRDELELGVLRAALARDLPVFAICRGQQILNVGLGGTLLRHIAGDAHRALDEGLGDSRWHEVTVEPGTKLAALIGAGAVTTNSRHHQAVPADGVGEGLVVSAVAADGIVEGVEAPAYRWVLGVQWHPERVECAERFRPLFTAFLQAAAEQPQPAGAGDD
jgi:gamma-glutamyl-gamma-aminobutyrate hydrolase PuuD